MELEERRFGPSESDGSRTFTKEEVDYKMMTANRSSFGYRQWELYRAFVVFDDFDDVYKSRPIVVYEDLGDTVLALKCTSKRYPQDSYYTKYPIEQWELAGLDRESYVCLTNKVEISKDYIHDRLGKLKSADVDNIRSILIG